MGRCKVSYKEDLTGKTFNRLTVITPAVPNRSNPRWECLCSCGKKHTVLAYNLKNGAVKSCGCLVSDVTAARNYKHGKSYSREWRIWNNMMNRCYRKNVPAYKDYGGRGITVSKRWHQFKNFFEDMGYAPEGLTLDRQNNNKGYTKKNCRWVSRLVQARNARSNRIFTFKGKTKCLSEWAQSVGITTRCLFGRLKRGWTFEQAINT